LAISRFEDALDFQRKQDLSGLLRSVKATLLLLIIIISFSDKKKLCPLLLVVGRISGLVSLLPPSCCA
jgi:hypothetical protein